MIVFDDPTHNDQLDLPDFKQHWCPRSEKYAGGDALVSLLNAGWQVQKPILYENAWLNGGRHVTVYYFELEKNNDYVKMPVLANPFVLNIITRLNVRVLPVWWRKSHTTFAQRRQAVS